MDAKKSIKLPSFNEGTDHGSKIQKVKSIFRLNDARQLCYNEFLSRALTSTVVNSQCGPIIEWNHRKRGLVSKEKEKALLQWIPERGILSIELNQMILEYVNLITSDRPSLSSSIR